MRKEFKTKRLLAFVLAIMMLITAFPLQAMAAQLNYDDIGGQKSTYINNVDPVTPGKAENATEYIKEPVMPEIYTLRTDYMVKKNGEWKINYQPYVVSVGQNATPEEKAKVNKTINLPDLKGYEKPQESFDITYKSIVDAAKSGQQTGDTWQKNQDFKYPPKENYINVKHVFQSLTDFNEYGPKDGDTDAIYTTAKGKTGSLLEVTSLPKSSIEGFEPETDILSTIVPEDTKDFEIEYRYHRKDYDVNYDTVDGNAIPSRRLYYGQKIPTVETPTKNGSVFLGWKPSANLVGVLNSVEKNFNKDEVIKDAKGDPIFDLNAKLKMPAQDITFTAVWKDAPKADYLIQFWTEKTDYDDKDDTLPLRDRYDYIGSRRIEQVDTGLIPDLTKLSIDGITFPDLNDGRLEKAQKDPEEFARYYFLNKDLTKKQNASKKDPNVQKSVLSTGETVYNVYYDRRVYTLYFTAANELAFDNAGSFWPIITRDGQIIGQEGSPYKAEVRFNQSLNKIWPKDAEVSNLPPGGTDPDGDTGLIGWIINNNAGETIFRDTPPYRLSAEDFIDAEDVMSEEDYYGYGHADQIPIKDGQTKTRDKYEISLGSTSLDTAVVHHIDIIKDDFDGKEQIDYDMSYWKSDTNAVDYDFILPHLQGFTLKEETRKAEWIYTKKSSGKDKTFDELNTERNKKTPFRSDDDKIEYIDQFPWGTKSFDGKNAYNYANYTRNKYKLKLNDDPKKIKNDNEYTDGKDRFDVPYEMPLNNLQLDTNNKPERPEWVPENWEFKGWATDPAGENLLKKGKETKLHYDQFIFAKWGEPDYKWKVTIDPDGGNLKDIKLDDLIIKEKANQDLTKVATKLSNEGSKQIFEVNHRAKLKRLPIPRRKGHDFLGWQLIRYNEDGSVDTSYIDEYGVPELYAFGNDLVTDVYLKAIWLSNDKIDIPVYHHFLDKDGNEIESLKVEKVIDDARVGYYTAASASEQNQEWLLMPKEELEALADDNPVKIQYTKYNESHPFNNADYHSLKVEPLKILDTQGQEVDNPKAENNEFHFYYRRFKTRDFKVNYLDKKAKDKIDEIIKSTDTVDAKKDAIKAIVDTNSIIPQEEVVSRNRHYDARNYRHIPGWKLASDPQQQLFYDVDEATGEFKGINGTGLDEIFFYYEDVRVIDVPENDPVPEGYVRITFKADKGGAFTDKDGNPKTEIYYDVIKGLKSDLLVVPQELQEGADKEDGKYYITPDAGKKFTKWDEKPLLNDNTIIESDYTFTAYFDWSGLSAKGLVTTEAFKEPNNTWTNDFAPKINDLKNQLEWKEKDVVKPLPAGTDIKFFDENGNELKTDEDIFNLVNEKKAADKDELVRTVNIKAKVTFPDKKEPQELDIPVKVYKNVYEALTTGEKPLFLSEAEKGELKDITGNYVKVTVNPTGKPGEKDSKIYYVNPKAWVEIPEITLTEDEKEKLGFTNWSADKDAQNENGVYDFTKRHMFTEDTVISSGFEKDVVEQTDTDKKPPVPESYVKVIVKTTDKATDETAFEKTFWVNSSKEVTIQVYNPVGKTVDKTATEEAKAYTFTGWKSDEQTPRTWTNEIKGQFKNDTTITAQYDDVKNIIPYNPDEPITRPDGYVRVKFEADDGLTLSNVNYYYVKANAGITLAKLAKPDVAEKTGYKFDKWDKDDAFEIINDDVVVKALSTKLDNVIPETKEDGTPNTKPDGYKEVIFVADANGKLDGVTKFFVNPDEFVTINPPKAVGNTGYEFGAWDKDANIPTVYKDEVTTITASFNQIKDVIPKTKDDDSEKPAGYKTVTFVIEGEGGKIVDGETITYFVDPNRQVTIQPPTTNADTGYKFNAWDKDTTVPTSYAVDTTVKGTFSKLEDIIPATDDNPKPDGYVTVTFDKGEHGTKIEGQRIYYVNPKANISLGDTKIVKPTVSPETGWKANGWDEEDAQLITGDLTVNAQYAPIDDVIPKTQDDESDKPEGYITVTFVKGDHGKELTGQAVYYVNPNKSVVLKDKAPTAVPNKGYTFARWDVSIEKAIQYKDGDKITALYNEPGDISETEVEGYVKVEFNKGQYGALEGKTEYWVKPGVEVNVPAPTVKPNVGYKFTGWDKDLTVTLKANDPTYVITAEYEDLENIIPQKNTDGSDKPEGYITVTFKADANGSLSGTTVYYVKPNVEVDLTNTADAITKKADVGYTAEGGTWSPAITKQQYTANETYTFNFAKLGDVIPKTTDDESEKPEGYVSVKFIPTANAVDLTEKVYYVNPKENVTLPIAGPVGKEVTDISGTKYTFNFKLWTVTRGNVATWNKGTPVSGVFIQDTEITAKYNIEYKQLINGPVPKDDVVTGKGDVPAPEDLIKNIPSSGEKDSLPEGTTFTYTNDGTPDVSNPGTTTAKVEVHYPDGKISVVEVPIKVVDYVVPQIGNDKPLVPDTYVKVTVDTTDNATENTKFTKVFWVKPNVEVTLPDILAPTGKAVVEDGVTKTNRFVKWQLVGSNPAKFYDTEITDTFTKDEMIVATYEFNKNIEPQPNNDQWIPKGSDPKAKDFIKNPYDDNDPKNMDNLPPGTSFEFVPGTEPDTNEPGVNKTTTIKVTYPNGEVKIVEVKYNVTEDVVEQVDDRKPIVPDKFVEVVVDTTNLATRETYSFKTYWVNPDRIVTIRTEKPEGIKDDKDNRVWLFDYWQADSKSGEGTRYRDVIEDRFTEDTYIKAYYYKADIPEPGSDYVVTDVNVFPDVDEYRSRITPPDGKDIDYVTILKQPDVSKAGNRTQAEIEVVYTDGTRSTVWVPVYVQRPGETNTRIVYRDRIVEKEKIVEKIVKIKDNQRLKEVRFMQGFEGKFRPHDGLTRAEAAQILANALKQDGYNYNPAYPINYKDVKQKWYTEAIVITTQANVFKGYDDGYFRPEEKISRAEWIATLKRFQQLQDADGNRMGLKENHWAKREVEAAYEEGWLQIYTNGNAKFDANEPITREEVAAVSNRAFGRLVDKTYILRNDKSVINYKDINPSMWSYADILCASNSFIRDENYYMSHGIEYINSIVNSIDGNIIFNVELKNFEIIQDKFQRYLR